MIFYILCKYVVSCSVLNLHRKGMIRVAFMDTKAKNLATCTMRGVQCLALQKCKSLSPVQNLRPSPAPVVVQLAPDCGVTSPLDLHHMGYCPSRKTYPVSTNHSIWHNSKTNHLRNLGIGSILMNMVIESNKYTTFMGKPFQCPFQLCHPDVQGENWSRSFCPIICCTVRDLSCSGSNRGWGRVWGTKL